MDIDPKRILPPGAHNPYAAHPGFSHQGCCWQLVVIPQHPAGAHGFACLFTGNHCEPCDLCDRRREQFQQGPLTPL